MNPIAWLLGLFLPACGAAGADGLPPPVPMDVMRIERPSSPNTALAAPAGFTPAPDVVTHVYTLPPARLFAAVRATAEAQPRVYRAALFPDRLQAHYVARTAIANFPDLVTVQVLPSDGGGGTLVVWSRSVYGYSDMGVNRARVDTWLSALERSITER